MGSRHIGTAALVTAAVLVFGVAVAQAAPPAPLTDDPAVGAAGAATWLSASIDPDGLAAGPSGTADPNTTRQSAMALAVAGAGDAALNRALGALVARPEALVDAAGQDRPAALSELIIALVAAGRDPRAFGAAGDLVARLEATVRTAGSDAGLFGAQDPTYDGAYRQGLALAALEAAGSSAPSAAGWLRAQRCADGAFTAYRASLTQPCPAIDAATFSGPDTNSTALAVIGLAAAGDDPDTATMAWLGSKRAADGGWAYLPADGSSSDPNSTALVISAYDAAGIDPDGLEGGPARAVLTRFQFGCDAAPADRGALWFPPFVEEDGFVASALATAQALPALAGVDLADLDAVEGIEEGAPCATPATTTTTAATPTSAPSTSVAPTTTAPTGAVLGRAATRAPAATPATAGTVDYAG